MPKATSLYNLKGLMLRAWAIAKYRAKHQGGRARDHLAQALRECWALAKKSAADILASRQRVQAEIERIRYVSSEIGRARHERHMAAFRAKCDADLAVALEMSRQLTQPAIRRAA
jgi:hypothetical protein